MTRVPAGGGGYDFSLLPADGVQDLMNADTATISQMASTYQQIAEAAGSAADSLRGKAGGVTWEGAAADKFRANVNGVPKALDAIHTSYVKAARVLNQYEPEVASAQSKVGGILTQLESIHDQLTSAQSQLSTAQSTQANAQTTVNNQPAKQSADTTAAQNKALSTANASVTDLSGSVSRLQTEFNTLQDQGKRVVKSWEGEKTTAANALKDAASNAPQPGWFSSFLHAVGGFIEDIGKGVLDTFKNAADIISAIGALVKNPLSLKNWIRFGRDAVAVGTIALMVTGLGEAGLASAGITAAGEDAAEGEGESLLGQAASAFSKTNKAFAEGGKFAKGWKVANEVNTYDQDGYNAADNAIHGRWGAAAGDVGDLALDGAGDAASHYAESGKLFGKDLGGHWGGIDKATGAETAEKQFESADKFSNAKTKLETPNANGFANHYNPGAVAFHGLSGSEQKSLLSATGATLPKDGLIVGTDKHMAMAGANRTFLNNLAPDTKGLAKTMGHKSLIAQGASLGVDKTVDTTKEHVRAGVGLPDPNEGWGPGYE